ncbi:hypothetical protein HUA76_32430 [Myxococcus sp. CA056]|uniref:hypothetical protein n=1 Tax=Myxococcus sp. CA056 TaxID=2741740 RepID=UPI00157B6115|nr:hypothetical protein [Myxococcus sp. CA056]NTX15488.1 hypothetical protein [Myxococcus sp. CA056]
MEVSLKTRVTIWGRAGARCSFPSCRRELIYDASETDDESLVGDIAHIVAESPDGPRGESQLTPEQRSKYQNLILLCKLDHKRIDDQFRTYPVEALQQMKADHEDWIKSSLNIDQKKQRDREVYADVIDRWADASQINTWQAWTSAVFCSDRPKFEESTLTALEPLQLYFYARIWPKRYPDLEAALINFGTICDDMLSVFSTHSTERGRWRETDKFYKSQYHPEQVYQKLLREYEFHVDLVEDLLIEMTRAANYVCDKIRESIEPTYRVKEGALLITRGPYNDLSIRHMRPEYRDNERVPQPYPGLKQFLSIRSTRDIVIGRGTEPAPDPREDPSE